MLVFIHGAACTPAVFTHQLSAFPDAVAIALPGHGAPGGAEDIASFADAVESRIASEEWRDVILCGSSMGGAIALEIAIRGKLPLAGLVTIGSGAKLRVAPAIIEALRLGDAAVLATLADAMFAEPTEETRAAMFAQFESVSPAQRLADFRACDAFDVRERLAAIAVPALMLVGERDVMTPPDRSLFLADRIAGAHVEVLPRLGHLAMLEGPEATNLHLAGFVDSIGG
ncbi:MAG: alpha/beta fold hydrolase [Candidatus Eremiobacteraeota bacterium]|nr:alpha/beta fold hydrolase [Candidatus Eremiobacteraeota bacterium]